jgi:hypothetical protein
MPIRSRLGRFSHLLAAGLVTTGLLLTKAAADDRLSGYWVPAPDRPERAVFSIGQLGKWAIVTQRWSGASASAPELKVRYLAATDGNHGTLTADQNLDKLPEAPRAINYRIEGGQLTLTVMDSMHAGTYELVKGTPPSHPALVPMGSLTPAPRPAPPVKPDFQWQRLLGGWISESQSNTEINLFISYHPKAGQNVFKVNQRWTKGSDIPAMSRGGDYVASTQADHGVLSKDKPDFEGSEIPLGLNFKFDGDNLIVTVESGAYAGQYRLVRGTK